MPISVRGEGILNGLIAIPETAGVIAGAPSATSNLDILTNSIVYYLNNNTTNFVINVRGDGGTTFNSICNVGNSYTIVVIVTNGATPYRLTGIQVDSVPVTIRWNGGAAPTSGTANAIDVYTFSIIKSAAAPTYTVLGSVSAFA